MDEFKDRLAARDPGRRRSLFSGLTGRRGDVSGTTPDRPGVEATRAKIEAAYGRTSRGALNTKAAAKDLGVSQRTVQRWVAAGGKHSTPRGDRMSALSDRSRKAATTQAGRRAAMRDMRDSQRGQDLAQRGGSLNVGGRQGVQGKKGFYIRDRQITLELTPGEVDAMWSAYEEGGDKAVSQWLTDHADDNYAAGWSFETIDNIEWDR